MKIRWILLLLPLFLLVVPVDSQAQTRKGHMTSKERVKMNKKSSRWAKRRIRASKGDLTNIKCSPRQTRRAARRSR